MDYIPIPYFGMIMTLLVLPGLTFTFITINKKIKADVEKLKYKKEILELEMKKEELRIQLIHEENKQYDTILESNINNLEEKK